MTIFSPFLVNNRRVYLEVDPRHPPLIRRWVEANVEEMRYVETRHDVSGRSVEQSRSAFMAFNQFLVI